MKKHGIKFEDSPSNHEPIILIQKPISEKTIADNVLKWGTGGLNIDQTRIETDEKLSQGAGKIGYGSDKTERHETKQNEAGRFPANSITEDENEFYSKYFNITPKELSKKAGKKDRNSDYLGNESLVKNNHSTVKPTALMQHFIKMITPYDGVVLDPFLGSGSTIVAARKLAHENEKYSKLNFIGSELSEEYFDICEARIFPNTDKLKEA